MRARPHPGQAASAERLRALLADSEIRESHRHGDPRVQDAYAMRCMPQVHGAARNALAYIRQVLETECNSATDNPLIFPDEGENGLVISGGNFHGQPIAQVLDLLAIALADLAAISERRIERLVNPDLSGDLPAFLTRDPGVCSGFMIAQITAAALVSENKVLCHPASVDSIPTGANKEDHVSMGAHGALKARRVLRNTEAVLAHRAAVRRAGAGVPQAAAPRARRGARVPALSASASARWTPTARWRRTSRPPPRWCARAFWLHFRVGPAHSPASSRRETTHVHPIRQSAAGRTRSSPVSPMMAIATKSSPENCT